MDATAAGVGKAVDSESSSLAEVVREEGGNRAMNFAWMLEAALPEICWEIIPEARLRKGSMGREREAELKSWHLCAVIRGAREGSMERRCAQAVLRRVSSEEEEEGGGMMGEVGSRMVPLGVRRGA
jgi:hypothetical protein